MNTNNGRRFSFIFALSAICISAFATTLPACMSASGTVDSEELVGAPEDTNETGNAVSGSFPVGSTLKSTTNVNLRKGPSTNDAILHVVPSGSSVTLMSDAPQNGFYKVKHNGTIGWSFGKYYVVVDTGSPTPSDPTGSDAQTQAVERAKQGVGFSYWWGHGRWLPEGPTAATKGSCSGSCPDCTHSGSYGADCSGYVAKIWQVPSSNNDIKTDSHPYSTANFVKDSALWSTVSRAELKKADALVYNTNGAGHIILFEQGDGWGSMYAYECKGCAAGCVYGIRTASDSYKGIRKTGW